MKRLFLIFCMFVGLGCCMTARADGTDRVYVDPSVAKTVIEKHFSHMVSGYFQTNQEDIDDSTVFLGVISAYNNMLKENDGFVSVSGIVDVCMTAFVDYAEYIKVDISGVKDQYFKDKCLAFVKDLVYGESEQQDEPTCPYTITKVNGSQSKIKYTLPDNSGFIRAGGSLAWRFFNPGNLRGSDLQCTKIRTKTNGSFAVFPDAETGMLALHKLLFESPRYRNLTVRKAIYKYAPPSQNNTTRYINKLKNAGVNVDSKLSDLSGEQQELLEEMIMTIEGWKVSGTETHF